MLTVAKPSATGSAGRFAVRASPGGVAAFQTNLPSAPVAIPSDRKRKANASSLYAATVPAGHAEASDCCCSLRAVPEEREEVGTIWAATVSLATATVSLPHSSSSGPAYRSLAAGSVDAHSEATLAAHALRGASSGVVDYTQAKGATPTV